MIVSLATELCNHHHNPILEHFHHPKKKLVPFSHHAPFLHQALAFSGHFI